MDIESILKHVAISRGKGVVLVLQLPQNYTIGNNSVNKRVRKIEKKLLIFNSSSK